jgi:hypothetical protein
MFHLIKWGFSYEELLNMPLTDLNFFTEKMRDYYYKKNNPDIEEEG